MRRRKPGNYMEKLMEKAAKVPKNSGLHHVITSHDDWCDLLSGKGPCHLQKAPCDVPPLPLRCFTAASSSIQAVELRFRHHAGSVVRYSSASVQKRNWTAVAGGIGDRGAVPLSDQD